MNTEQERIVARARSLSDEMVRSIWERLPGVIRGAAESGEEPHVILAALELTVAEMIRQMSCSFVPKGGERGMAQVVLQVVNTNVASTAWPLYRSDFDAKANALPERADQ